MITGFLSEDLLFPQLAARDKETAIAFLAEQIARCNPSVVLHDLVERLRERERQSSTALGDGLAVPHARLAGIDGVVAAFARSSEGLDWQSPDGRPVHLVLMLAGPAEQPGAYLKVLAAASRVLRDESCRSLLIAAHDAREMLAILRTQEQHTEQTHVSR